MNDHPCAYCPPEHPTVGSYVKVWCEDDGHYTTEWLCAVHHLMAKEALREINVLTAA